MKQRNFNVLSYVVTLVCRNSGQLRPAVRPVPRLVRRRGQRRPGKAVFARPGHAAGSLPLDPQNFFDHLTKEAPAADK